MVASFPVRLPENLNLYCAAERSYSSAVSTSSTRIFCRLQQRKHSFCIYLEISFGSVEPQIPCVGHLVSLSSVHLCAGALQELPCNSSGGILQAIRPTHLSLVIIIIPPVGVTTFTADLQVTPVLHSSLCCKMCRFNLSSLVVVQEKWCDVSDLEPYS